MPGQLAAKKSKRKRTAGPDKKKIIAAPAPSRRDHQKEHLKREIITIVDAIKKKRLQLKLGRSAEEENLQKMYKPITEPLKKLANSAPPVVNVKMEPPKIEKIENKEESQQTEKEVLPTTSDTPVFEYDPFTEEEHQAIAQEQTLDEFRREYQSLLDDNPDQVDRFLDQYEMLPKVYVDGLLGDTTGAYDTTFGVRYEPITNKFFLGNSLLEIDGDNLVIGGIRYKGTPGLYELIFKTNPIGYKKQDETAYKDILQRTNVHKRNYDPKQQVKGSKSHKYLQVIRPLTFRPRSASAREPIGHGLPNSLTVRNEPFQYVYWDDVNELVDRLRLLTASQQAGHTNHNNEILSILEELREAGVIE